MVTKSGAAMEKMKMGRYYTKNNHRELNYTGFGPGRLKEKEEREVLL